MSPRTESETPKAALLGRLVERMLADGRDWVAVDDLMDDPVVGPWVISVQIDSPLQQLLLDGVLSNFSREDDLVLTFTHERYLIELAGWRLADRIAQAIEPETALLEAGLGATGWRQTATRRAAIHLLARAELRTRIWDFVLRDLEGEAVFSGVAESFLCESRRLDPLELLLARADKVAEAVVTDLIERLNYNQDEELLEELYRRLIACETIPRSSPLQITRIAAAKHFLARGAKVPTDTLLRGHPELAPLHFRVLHEWIDLHRQQDRHEEARKAIAEADSLVEVVRPIVGGRALASFLTDASSCFADAGRYEQELQWSLRAEQEAIRHFGADGVETALYASNTALALMNLGRWQEAEEKLRRALALEEPELGHYHENVASRLGNLAIVRIREKKWTEALELLNEALRIDRALLGPVHETVATRLINLAHCHRGRGDSAAAAEAVRQARAIDLEIFGPDHPNLAYALALEASLHREQGQFGLAIQCREEAMRLNLRTSGGDSDKVSSDLSFLASCRAALGEVAAAEDFHRRAVAMDARLYPVADERRIDSLVALCRFCGQHGRKELGRESFQELLRFGSPADAYVADLRLKYPEVVAEIRRP